MKPSLIMFSKGRRLPGMQLPLERRYASGGLPMFNDYQQAPYFVHANWKDMPMLRLIRGEPGRRVKVYSVIDVRFDVAFNSYGQCLRSCGHAAS